MVYWSPGLQSFPDTPAKSFHTIRACMPMVSCTNFSSTGKTAQKKSKIWPLNLPNLDCHHANQIKAENYRQLRGPNWEGEAALLERQTGSHWEMPKSCYKALLSFTGTTQHVLSSQVAALHLLNCLLVSVLLQHRLSPSHHLAVLSRR